MRSHGHIKVDIDPKVTDHRNYRDRMRADSTRLCWWLRQTTTSTMLWASMSSWCGCVILTHSVVHSVIFCCLLVNCWCTPLMLTGREQCVYLCCYLARTSPAACATCRHQEWIGMGTRPSTCQGGLFSSGFSILYTLYCCACVFFFVRVD